MLSNMGRRAFVRDRILNAAFDLIAKRGYEAVSTREIASAAQVGPASMFKHFPTKEHLGRELYAVALAPILKAAAELEQTNPSPRTSVHLFVDLLYGLYDDRPRALALLAFPPHDFLPWEVDRTNSESVRAVLQRLSQLDDDGAAILWGALTGPICDRYLRRREGTMRPFAAAHAARIAALIPLEDV
jgi:AcrR family transcriptional regulator